MMNKLALPAVATCLMAIGCSQPQGDAATVDAQATTGDGAAAATASLEERLAPGVLSRIRDRESWRDKTLAESSLSQSQRAEAMAEVAMLYHAYDLFEEARDSYDMAVASAPEDFRWRYLRGLAQRRLNDLEAAAADFRQATQLAPEDVPSWVRLGEVARDRGEADSARSALDRALELDERCAAAMFAFGQQARVDGDLELAADYFERVLELQPSASAVRTPLGLTYRDLGREAEAVRELERAGDQGVRLVDPLLQRIHDLGEGWIGAMRAASEAAEAGDLATAEEKIRVAIAIDPLSVAPRISWARILIGRGELDQAREQTELALFLSADELMPRRTMARIALAEQDWPQAERELRRIADLPTAERSDFENLAALLESSSRQAEALTIYRNLRSQAPDDAELVLSEATQLVQLERCAEALDIVAAQRARRANDAILGHAESRLLSTCPGAKNADQALALAQSLFTAASTAGHAEAVALALASASRFAEASEWQRRAIELAGDSSPALAHYRSVLREFEQGTPTAHPWPQAERNWIFAGPAPASVP